MKTSTWITALSLMANVLLAHWWFQGRSPAHTATALPGTQHQALAVTPKAVSPAATSQPAASPVPVAPAFSWRHLKTNDLKQFVLRLRAVGCPELTVQDIICAEVNRIYALKIRELWPDRQQPWPFWKNQPRDPDSQKKYSESSRKEKELQKEKTALLVELLGVDPEKQHRQEKGQEEPARNPDRLAFIPEAKRAEVKKYLDDFDAKMQDFYQRNRGQWDSQSRAEQKQLEAERLQGLAQFLTPQEVREYDLRNSQLANQMSYELRSMPDLTRDQYEALFDIRKKYGDSIYNYSDEATADNGRKAEENKKAMEAEVAAALGADTGKNYQRSQDYSYQQLIRLANRNDLPPETAGKIFDFKDAAEKSVKQIQANNRLTDEQKQQAIAEIGTETVSTIESTLGKKAFKRYQRDGGWWLQNLAPPRPRPAP